MKKTLRFILKILFLLCIIVGFVLLIIYLVPIITNSPKSSSNLLIVSIVLISVGILYFVFYRVRRLNRHKKRNAPLKIKEQVDNKNAKGLKEAYEALKNKDFIKAADNFLIAAQDGSVEAMYQLGNIYFKDHCDLHRDEEKALKYYKMAGDKGHIKGMYGAGYCYQYGAIVKRDYDAAIRYYKAAIEKADDTDSINNLGLVYKTQNNVPLAYKYLKEAADRKHIHGLYNFGVFLYDFMSNTGYEFYKSGLKCIEEAAKLGNEKAKKWLIKYNKEQEERNSSTNLANKSSSSKKVTKSVSSSNTFDNDGYEERIFSFDKVEIISSLKNPHKDYISGFIVFDLFADVTFYYLNSKGTVWKIETYTTLNNVEADKRYTEYDLKNDSKLKKYLGSFVCKKGYERQWCSGEGNIDHWQ